MFCVSGFCIVLPVFVQGRVTCLFSVFFVLQKLFVNVLFCDFYRIVVTLFCQVKMHDYLKGSTANLTY